MFEDFRSRWITPCLWGVGEAVGDLFAVADHDIGRQAGLADDFRKRLAIEKFHHDVVAAFGFADVVDGADVGMIERGGGAGLADQQAARGIVREQLGGQDFEGDVATELLVARAIRLRPCRQRQFFR